MKNKVQQLIETLNKTIMSLKSDLYTDDSIGHNNFTIREQTYLEIISDLNLINQNFIEPEHTKQLSFLVSKYQNKIKQLKIDLYTDDSIGIKKFNQIENIYNDFINDINNTHQIRQKIL